MDYTLDSRFRGNDKWGVMKTVKVLWGATDLGTPHFSGDLLWKTGFRAPDGFFLVEIGGATTLLLSPLEIGRAKKEAAADRVLLFDRFLKRGEAQTHGLIRFLKAQKIREVIVPHAFPHGIGRTLGEVFKVCDGGHSLYPERARKSKKEIAEITAAQRACEDALSVAVAFLRACTIKKDRVYDGSRIITSEIIRRIIDDVLWRKGYLASGTIVACGVQAADPHRMGNGPITARQPIVMDIFPVSLTTHYWADMTRTFFKGEPSGDFARMYEAVAGAQETAIKMIRPGADGGAVHRAAAEYLTSHGFPTRIASGHAKLERGYDRWEEYLAMLGKKLLHVHLSENDGSADQHLPPGSAPRSTTDWPKHVAKLKTTGYDGTITLEVFSPDKEYLFVSRDLLRKWWAEG